MEKLYVIIQLGREWESGKQEIKCWLLFLDVHCGSILVKIVQVPYKFKEYYKPPKLKK